ncbi:hypothetical protein M8J76_002583 [Diaphorina citri]|nr:hypothetical protein M8J76_002583 [Diaphorina citri]
MAVVSSGGGPLALQNVVQSQLVKFGRLENARVFVLNHSDMFGKHTKTLEVDRGQRALLGPFHGADAL